MSGQERIEIELDENTQSYEAVLESIRHNMNPDSNTVLVIDDETGIRKMVKRSFKNFAPNLVVYEAVNGMEGLETLEKIRTKHKKDPLLIVLDLNMPIMDGWTFIGKMKKELEEQGKSFGIPIIVLSSTSGEKGLFLKKSVHDGKSGYEPLATVAKESCVSKAKYDTEEEKGLEKWLHYFLDMKK
jgi:CheY-like chemotaxis protein